jgi:anthranilate phosphoribosyltransferase
LPRAISRVVAGGDLSSAEMAQVFDQIMRGQATAAQIGGLLIGLRMKGETADEIAGAAQVMRAHATKIACPDPASAVDTCGTGVGVSGPSNQSTVNPGDTCRPLALWRKLAKFTVVLRSSSLIPRPSAPPRLSHE